MVIEIEKIHCLRCIICGEPVALTDEEELFHIKYKVCDGCKEAVKAMKEKLKEEGC